jgi:hypothetical protein
MQTVASLPPTASETIDWITIPAGVGETGRPRVSVVVAPKLAGPPGATRWRLEGSAFVDWPSSLSGRNLVCEVNGQAIGIRAVGHSASIQSSLWRALFNKDAIVQPFRSDVPGQATQRVVTNPAPLLAPHVESIYQDSVVKTFSGQPATPHADLAAFVPRSWSGTTPNAEPLAVNVAPTFEGVRALVSKFEEFHSTTSLQVLPTPTQAADAAAAGRDRVDVLIGPVHHLQTFYAGGRTAGGRQVHARFVLPVTALTPVGFRVTLLNVDVGVSAEVTTSDGSRIDSQAGVRPLRFDDTAPMFVREPDGWHSYSETRTDFHAAISALGHYPELMRRLGLVLDFELEKAVTDLPTQGLIAVFPTFPARSAGARTAYYWRRADSTGSILLFRPASGDRAAWNVEDGLLVHDSARHFMTHLDIDSAIHNLMVHASRVYESFPRVNIGRSDVDIAALPSLRHSGPSLYDSGVSSRFSRRLAANVASTTSSGPALLHAEDLYQGFRIDVRAGRSQSWSPLCGRHVRSWVGKTTAEGAADFDDLDEGWVTNTPVADSTSPDARLVVPDTVFRWDGWHMCVPFAGGSVGATGSIVPRQVDPPLPLNCQTVISPPSTKFPPLRFGVRYFFRARAVDLAGNSISPREADSLSAALGGSVFDAGTYTRGDNVTEPVCVRTTERGPGETKGRLVIRADETGKTEPRRWYFFPPPVSADLALRYGVLDREGSDKVFEILSAHSAAPLPGDVANDDVAWLKQHRTWLHRLQVPYIGDPAARGVMFNLDASNQQVVTSFGRPTQPAGFAPGEHRPVPLTVHGGQARVLKGNSRTASLIVPPGRRLALVVNTDVPGGALANFYLTQALARSQLTLAATTEAVVRQGRAVTPPHVLEVVHAVPAPNLPAGRKNIEFESLDVRRTALDPNAELIAKLWIDEPSTHHVDMIADWTDPVDDPKVRSLLYQKNSSQIGRVAVPDIDDASGQPFQFATRQTFSDTKHRFVSYRAQAFSRFADYYGDDIKLNPIKTSRMSVSAPRHVLNTGRPTIPTIAYVIPIWQFVERENTGGSITRNRLTALRVYLKRGWYSSGDNEMLAVVFPLDLFTPISDVLEPHVTRWAYDPAWQSGVLPTRITLDDVRNAGAKVEAIDLPITREDPATRTRTESLERVAIAAFDVKLDEDKGLLYVDIECRAEGNAYWPFIRFAVARYQPFSIDRFYLSETSAAYFAQLLPDRSLTLTKKRNTLSLRLTGPSYRPKSALMNVGGQVVGQVAPKISAWLEVSDDDSVGSWRSVAGSEVTLKERYDGPSLSTWSGELTLNSGGGSKHRVAIREEEGGARVPEDQGRPIVPRLTYLDARNFEGL